NFTGGLSAGGTPVLVDGDLSGASPQPAGHTASAGSSGAVARADHVHPSRQVSGTVTAVFHAGSSRTSAQGGCPADMFSAAPRVYVTVADAPLYQVGVGNITTTGCVISHKSAATGGSTSVQYFATQV